MLLKNRESSYPLWLSMLLLFLSGCSSSDQPELPESPISTDIPVRFSAYSNRDDDSQTKVIDENNATSFENGDCMGVFAYYNDSSTPDFMNNQAVTYDGSSWNYSPIKYWPAQGTLSFYGYWPHESNNQYLNVSSENSFPSFTYSNPNLDYDLMAADKVDVACPSRENISFTMKHILAKLTFSFTYAKSSDDEIGYEPVIHMVRFYDIPYTGTFKFQFENGMPVWESIGTETTTVKRLTKNAYGVIVTDSKKTIDDFTSYLFPGTKVSGTFDVSINNITYQYTLPSDKAFTVEMNKTYNLNFNIKRTYTGNYFIASYSIWEQGENISGKLQ